MVIDHEPTRLFSGPGRRNGQVYALGEFCIEKIKLEVRKVNFLTNCFLNFVK